MFLKVLCLSDICNGSGDKIITRSWHNYHPTDSKYLWPTAVKPSAANWNTWEVAITSTFQVGWYLTIPQKMGQFYPQKNTGWSYDPKEQALWQNQNGH